MATKRRRKPLKRNKRLLDLCDPDDEECLEEEQSHSKRYEERSAQSARAYRDKQSKEWLRDREQWEQRVRSEHDYHGTGWDALGIIGVMAVLGIGGYLLVKKLS